MKHRVIKASELDPSNLTAEHYVGDGPKRLILQLDRVTVLITHGTDQVCIHPKGLPTPFPEMKYPAVLRLDARKGYGVTWCRKFLGVEPEVIDTTGGRHG